jgi:hypothetical protein
MDIQTKNNLAQMKTKILNWLKEFVEQPHPKLGNWAPCPYARAARINNQIEIYQGTNALIDFESIDLETKEVYVFWYPVEQYTGEQFAEITQTLNETLMPQDIVVLEDHPDLVEHVNGVHMNFGEASLHVIQKLSKLNEAADKLERQGYYKHWTQEELDEVKTWRYDR